jgi:hypothetical protein
MPAPLVYYLSPPTRRPPHPLSAGLAVVAAAAAILVLPGAESASLWRPIVVAVPTAAAACFALACALAIGCAAGLTAHAVGRRDALRPALHAAITTALFAPAALAVPLWPALLAAAGLIALPVRVRPTPANDNPIPVHRQPHPFSLAA